ncbi:unnamed protein product [Porites evermanni]|uniref:Fibrinogen C-terminal domain-containing protein n=1 Tax=Porites evermanni TaxID=104178 RepID=A0ABN8S446_9CNID|nr:unnamed protein product [Porites evermanni]
MLRLFIAFFLVMILRSFASQKNSVSNESNQNHYCNCRDGRDGRDGQNGKDGLDGRDGINAGNGTKGQKGERGSSGNNAGGVIKFSDTAEKCTASIAGTVSYNTSQKSLQLCDGSVWLPVLTVGKGYTKDRPGRHCLDILNSGQSHGSGLYWIDPNGGSTGDSFQAFCDMKTERGGWTLVATKVSPGFLLIKTVFSAVAAATKNRDAASHIHPSMGNWKEVMFRFADVDNTRVIYNRKAGAPNKDKEEFDKFLMGKYMNLVKNVNGFHKYSPADNKRNPSVGFATISSFCFWSAHGISEDHGGTDKWLDMWHAGDSSNNYIYSDNSRALGTKCIAGYCYLNKPIWVMVR